MGLFDKANDRGIDVIDGALRSMRRGITDLKLGIELCKRQEEANNQTIEELGTRNAALSAKAAGAESLIREIDSIVPPSLSN